MFNSVQIDHKITMNHVLKFRLKIFPENKLLWTVTSEIFRIPHTFLGRYPSTDYNGWQTRTRLTFLLTFFFHNRSLSIDWIHNGSRERLHVSRSDYTNKIKILLFFHIQTREPNNVRRWSFVRLKSNFNMLINVR